VEVGRRPARQAIAALRELLVGQLLDHRLQIQRSKTLIFRKPVGSIVPREGRLGGKRGQRIEGRRRFDPVRRTPGVEYRGKEQQGDCGGTLDHEAVSLKSEWKEPGVPV
jgi:hypothetical protein